MVGITGFDFSAVRLKLFMHRFLGFKFDVAQLRVLVDVFAQSNHMGIAGQYGIVYPIGLGVMGEGEQAAQA